MYKNLLGTYLNGQLRVKYLAASIGKLKAEKQKSEKANDSKNGVVECVLKVDFQNNTRIVKKFPKHPKILQITAAHAATLEMFSSNIIFISASLLLSSSVSDFTKTTPYAIKYVPKIHDDKKDIFILERVLWKLFSICLENKHSSIEENPNTSFTKLALKN